MPEERADGIVVIHREDAERRGLGGGRGRFECGQVKGGVEGQAGWGCSVVILKRGSVSGFAPSTSPFLGNSAARPPGNS